MSQLSAAVPGPDGKVRMIPISYRDASSPRKPRKTASPRVWEAYREALKQTNLNARALSMLQDLQQQRQPAQGPPPPLHVVVDGSYTNRKVLKHLPPQTTLIGRIRKDARLHFPPQAQLASGRPRVYGQEAPTPEELRTDPRYPWQRIWVHANGRRLRVRIKTLGPLRWRAAGTHHFLRLVVVAPRRYRKNQQAKLLYRQPTFLICTDPELPVETMVQEYIWRWDIEVCHRDEKTLLGVGEAQVRNPQSVESVPAMAVGAYAMLQLAAIRAYGWNAQPNVLPPPKWRNPELKHRASTLDLINELRRELWASAIRPSHLPHFVPSTYTPPSSEKPQPSLYNAVFYATA
jgi:hypothetical protein